MAATPFVSLLGPELLRRDGSKVATSTALAGKRAVALYFSAHWCGPCREFSPFLAKAYSQHLVAKGIEVVFVSADDSEASFTQYFDTMPWLALPFGSSFMRKTRKFKGNGIPQLVILDGVTGKLLTSEGRMEVVKDPKGERFPWKAPDFWQLIGDEFLQADGETIEIDEVKGDGKVIALYFAGAGRYEAVCKEFTQRLAAMYAASLKDRGLEVIFVPLDADNMAFTRHFQAHPWLALPFGDKRIEAIMRQHKVQSVPHLMLFDGVTGRLINGDARKALMADPTCARFPWPPPAYHDLARSTPQELMGTPSVCIFMEGCAAATQAAVRAAIEPVAKAHAALAARGECDEVVFCVVSQECNLGEQLRALTHQGAEKAAVPRALLIDIADDGAYYTAPAGEVTQDTISAFVQEYAADALPRQQMPRNH